MRFASIGSGSRGNGSLVSVAGTTLLIDCGFSLKVLTQRLAEKALEPSHLTAILVTHEHADHIRGVGALARKFNLPVYLTRGTAESKALGVLPQKFIIEANQSVQIGAIEVVVNPVPHDAREPVQFIFSAAQKRLGLLTDIGNIPDWLAEKYQSLNGLILEANYCPEMLSRGPYPPSLKSRVGSAWGHLSNHQCATMVEQLNLTSLQHLVIAHISQKNNTPERILESLAHLPKIKPVLKIADQETGFDWLQIA